MRSREYWPSVGVPPRKTRPRSGERPLPVLLTLGRGVPARERSIANAAPVKRAAAAVAAPTYGRIARRRVFAHSVQTAASTQRPPAQRVIARAGRPGGQISHPWRGPSSVATRPGPPRFRRGTVTAWPGRSRSAAVTFAVTVRSVGAIVVGTDAAESAMARKTTGGAALPAGAIERMRTNRTWAAAASARACATASSRAAAWALRTAAR